MGFLMSAIRPWCMLPGPDGFFDVSHPALLYVPRPDGFFDVSHPALQNQFCVFPGPDGFHKICLPASLQPGMFFFSTNPACCGKLLMPKHEKSRMGIQKKPFRPFYRRNLG